MELERFGFSFQNRRVFSIVMLTGFDRLSLKEEVKRAKRVDVSKQAFIKLKPNDRTCEIIFDDTEADEPER